MTRSQLILRLAAQNPGLTHREVERIVSAIFETIAAGLARGDRIELRGFGSFATANMSSSDHETFFEGYRTIVVFYTPGYCPTLAISASASA